jgi:Protein of unknown function (DUF2786)
MTAASTTPKEILDRVGKLVALAQSDNEEEARSAAVQATRLMKDHRLVLVPQSEIDRIKTVIGEAQALAQKHESSATQKMMLGALAGFLVGNGKIL